MYTNVLTAALFVVGLLGCGTIPESDGEDSLTAAALTPSAGSLPEYRHTIDHSRMAVGPGAVSRVELGYQKVVGDWGTHAINLTNGYVQGVPNAGAAMLDRRPYGKSLAQHNEHVKAMFVAAGIPAAEIGAVGGGSGGMSGGRANEVATPYGPPAYISGLSRVADGIVVADSFAWARINEDDEVVSEGVYWPAIPRGVIEEAKALRTKLDSPGERQAFVAKLPAGAGRVVIRHTSATTNEAFEAFAVYDVTTRTGGYAITRHFDASGTEVRLPQERRAAPANVRSR